MAREVLRQIARLSCVHEAGPDRRLTRRRIAGMGGLVDKRV